MTDIEALVPRDRLLRKIEKVMDYDWLYERLSPYYKENVGRPGIDPVVLIKMALLEHLYGIRSLRQTYRDIQVNVAYRRRQRERAASPDGLYPAGAPGSCRPVPEDGAWEGDLRTAEGHHRAGLR